MLNRKSRLALLATVLIAGHAQAALHRTIMTTNGPVTGTTRQGSGSTVFKGVPYAAAPIGELRWRPPVVPPAWRKARATDRFADDCLSIRPSPDTRAPGRSEDCLYLNVWTPARSARDKLPVMVWIYGGAFIGGSATLPQYDGEGLNRKGVILVSFNFRTGVFGFLAHPGLSAESSHRASGNYGLLDAVAALHWVRANIARFGGDPARVTVFGQSSGSQTVNLLTVSPLSRGLFQRAIGQSGAGFGEREPKPLAVAEQGGADFAAPFGGTAAALRHADAGALLAAARLGQFEPVVDGWALPENPHTLLAKGLQNDVPTLVGSNADETQLSPTMTRADYEAQIRSKYGSKAAAVLARFPAADDSRAPLAAKSFGTLVLGSYNVGTWAGEQTRTGRSPVFQYYFTHVPPSATGHGPSGAAHGAEIPYAFNSLDMLPQAWTAADRKLADLVSSYWTNFARTGDPNGPGLPRWPTTRDRALSLLEIGNDTHVIPRPNVADLAFMESIFYGPDGLFGTRR